MKKQDQVQIHIDGTDYTYRHYADLPLLVDGEGTLYVRRGSDGQAILPTPAEIDGLLAAGRAWIVPAEGGRGGDVDEDRRALIVRRLLKTSRPPRRMSNVEKAAEERVVLAARDGLRWTEQADDALNAAATHAILGGNVSPQEAYRIYERAIRSINDFAGRDVVSGAGMRCFRRRMNVVAVLLDAAGQAMIRRRGGGSVTIH